MAVKIIIPTVDHEAVYENYMPPEFIAKSGQAFTLAYGRFFAARLNNNTNEAYSRALSRFLKHLEAHNIALKDLTAMQVSQYATLITDKRRKDKISNTTLRQHLSAIRMFFNECVLTGALTSNPATVVKPPKQSRKHGKTRVIVPAQVTAIFDTIPLKTQADYRDRALIGLMVYSFYRISAALSMTVADYELRGNVRWLVGQEKGGKTHDNPVHQMLREYIDEHLAQADIEDKPDSWLFPSAHGRSGRLNGKQYHRSSAWEMVRRRALAADVHTKIGNHTFRATGITAYMNSGGSLDKAQSLAGHEHISTTKLYDRSDDEDKVSEIARLSF